MSTLKPRKFKVHAETSNGRSRRKRIVPQEVAAVTALAGPKRYAHLVSQVADWQEIWGLRTAEGWVSAAGETGQRAFPVWPHEAYAAQCLSGTWLDAVPTPIDVHEFLISFVPNLTQEQTLIAVFPTPSGAVVSVRAEEFAASIQSELSRIE
jgi:hypothetical protein